MSDSKRNEGLDFIKGMSIILVVLIHALPFESLAAPLNKIFYAIFLNSFFAVTGYISYTSISLYKYLTVRKKFVALIKPYILYSLLTIGWHLVIVFLFQCTEVSENYFGSDLIRRDIFCATSGLGIGTLWFLPVLFISFVIFVYIVCLLGRFNRLKRLLFVAFLLSFALLSKRLTRINVAESNLIMKIVSEYMYMLHRITYGIAYMLLGWLVHDLYKSISNRKPFNYGFVPVPFIVAGVAFVIGMDIAFEGALVVGVVYTSVLIANLEIRSLRFVCRPIVYCGKHSLQIMFYHYNIIWPVQKMIMKRYCGERYSKWVFFALNLLITLVLIFTVEGIKKTKMLKVRLKYGE